MTTSPTPDTPDQVREIARKLSPAMKSALISDGYALPSMGPLGFNTIMLGFEHGRSAKALYARGLAQLPQAPQVLTRRGLAVRAHLLSQPHPEQKP